MRLVGTALLLLLVAIPRFDMWDPGPIARLTSGAKAFVYGHPLDVEGYIRLTRYFRGEMPADSMIAPYCFRPAVPLIASRIPVPPKTAIDLVNLACLVATLFVLDAFLALLGIPPRGRAVGGLLFALSFPVFYYGAIGMIDAAVVFCVTTLAWLALRRSPAWVQCLVAAATALVKETNVAFVGLGVVVALARRERLTLATFAPIAVGIATVLAVRTLLPFPEQAYFWYPSMTAAVENLSRPRTLFSLVLTLGIPVLAAALALITGRARAALGSDFTGFLLAGCGVAISLYLYSVVSAYTDGRIIWGIYPFAIPLAVSWFQQHPARAAA